VATRPARARTRATLLSAAVLSTALAVGLAAPLPAVAEPRPTIDEVQNRLDEIEEEAEAVAEERNGINIQVAETSRKEAKVRARIKAQEKALKSVQEQLGVFAAAAYRTGGLDSTLQLMLSEDPAGFLEQTNSLNAVARGQQSAMRRAAAARLELDQSRLELEQTLEVQKKAKDEVAKKSAAIQEKEDEAEALLDSLQEDERDRLEAAQAQRADAVRRASRSAVQSLPAPTPAPDAGPASGRAAQAVAYARAQVGKSYTWGGSGPSSFDCSGLTMRAWQQGGVSLPHQSGAQYAATRRVDRSELQPGDLLFFHSPISHVGIYAGGGMMIHAQNSATGVIVTPLSSRMSSYVGAGRP
jgi:cell wall-associated NlpC family hydrolase